VKVPSVTIKLVWHERTHRDPGMRAFRDVVLRSGRPQARPAD
jgi:DNA-binding transcriptional LysR family regulator